MKKAIVTGSNGFVGSNVCKRLCADGVKVYAVVKDKNEKINNIEKLDGIEIVYCELDEIETLFDKISDRDVDVFYHFAWVGSARSDVTRTFSCKTHFGQLVRSEQPTKCSAKSL